MNITNPKVAIFFLAFLPQFADPARGSITVQMLFLSGLFIVSTLIVFATVAWFAGFIGEWLQRSARVQVVLNRIAGMVFAVLALRLAVSERQCSSAVRLPDCNRLVDPDFFDVAVRAALLHGCVSDVRILKERF
tara:strand:+ start:166 stop:567 length:402 start_codon:yes stop_codon:yes gene_type:complete